MKKILFLSAFAIGMMAFAGEPVKGEPTKEQPSKEVKQNETSNFVTNDLYKTEEDGLLKMCCRSADGCDGNQYPVCVVGSDDANQSDLCRQAQRSALLMALDTCR